MTFLQPLLLLALLTLPLIVVLHLLRERRRRVAVPSLLHWLNVPRRREGERTRRLPLTLLLLLHLLVAALLGLAVGRPQLPGALSDSAEHTAIVIDVSTSMAASTGAASRLALAQEQARDLLRGLGPGDRATLIAAGPSARVVAAGGANELGGLSQALAQLQPGGTGTNVDAALTLAEAALDPQYTRRIIVLTDGALPPLPARNLPIALEWQQIGDAQPNRALIAFAARAWGRNLQVYARAVNYSDEPTVTTLRLYADEQLVDTREVAIAADGEAELTWTLPADHATLRAVIEGNDGLPQDDQAYLNVALARPVRALLVSSQPDPLRRALSAIPGVDVSLVEPANYTEAAGSPRDLTIFEGFLPQSWPEGAILAINPPPGNPLVAFEPRAQATVTGELRQTGPTLAGLTLDGVNFGTVQPVAVPDWAETQLAIGSTPLILRGRNGSNEIGIWTFDLASGNLPTRLAFPLLVARSVRDLTPAPLPPNIQAGAPLMLQPDPRAATIQVSGPTGALALSPAPNLTIDTLVQPGFYQVEEQRDGATIFAGQVGVNAGAAIESDLRPQPAPAIDGTSQNGGPVPERSMRDLWPWLALGALVFLMLEWGYIHR